MLILSGNYIVSYGVIYNIIYSVIIHMIRRTNEFLRKLIKCNVLMMIIFNLKIQVPVAVAAGHAKSEPSNPGTVPT